MASDIAVEAEVALELSRQIKELDRRIDDLYLELDPARIVMSVPGVGATLAAEKCGTSAIWFVTSKIRVSYVDLVQ